MSIAAREPHTASQRKPGRPPGSINPRVRDRNLLWLGARQKLGMSVRDIAYVVGAPASTVRSGIRKAEHYGRVGRSSCPADAP